MRIRSALLFCGLMATPAFADKLLEVESEEQSQAAEPKTAPAPAPAPVPSRKLDAENESSGLDLSDWSFSGGFSAGSNELGGSATVGYSFNRYLGVDTTYSYLQRSSGKSSGVAYGPEVAGIVRVPNPTIITPFVGAGPGYVKWQRSYDDDVFDAGAAWLADVFGGVNIRLARHFGLQVKRQQIRYLQDPPKTYADRTTREPRERMATAVGFYMAF